MLDPDRWWNDRSPAVAARGAVRLPEVRGRHDRPCEVFESRSSGVRSASGGTLVMGRPAVSANWNRSPPGEVGRGGST